MNVHVKAPGINWTPDYVSVLQWRQDQLIALADANYAGNAFDYYSQHPIEFVNAWVSTVDPRNAFIGKPVRMPFVLFPKQEELLEFLLTCLERENSGLIEKSRDMGATWAACAFSVWLWLFRPGSAIGWGSRSQDLVDRIGDMSSIFEKLRDIVKHVPPAFMPRGFNPERHLNFMRVFNASTGSQITGEIGDNIGRGGRTLIYFKDESAHYSHPDMIEAALSENTRVQIDISSVNGPGNVFYRKREAGIEWDRRKRKTMARGKTWVFVMDWRDNPLKTEEWYEQRRKEFEENGLLHVFKQEVDRNYSAAVDNTLISDEWVRASIDAHIKLNIPLGGKAMAGLDVADGGMDLNAAAVREGIVLAELDEWGSRDTAVSARRFVGLVTPYRPVLAQYDATGIGAGVKAEINRLNDDKLLPTQIYFKPWNGGASVQNPDTRLIKGDPKSLTNKLFFHNLKAQAWWTLARRFEKTWRAVTQGVQYPHDELISLPSDLPFLRKLEKELCQVRRTQSTRLLMMVDKQPEGTRSPNLADAVVIAYFPLEQSYNYDTTGNWIGA